MAENAAHVPMALPRSLSSKVAPMIASEQGISSAAPAPCTTRARISDTTLVDNPHHTEAAAKIAVPMMNTQRRPS
jgi:hypothetical protein